MRQSAPLELPPRAGHTEMIHYLRPPLPKIPPDDILVENPGISYSDNLILIPDSRMVYDLILIPDSRMVYDLIFMLFILLTLSR